MTTYKTIASYEYNDDLMGFVVTFKSGIIAQTQFDKEKNRLHADFGEWCLGRYDEYDEGELTEEEEEELHDFIKNNEDVKAKDEELNSKK